MRDRGVRAFNVTAAEIYSATSGFEPTGAAVRRRYPCTYRIRHDLEEPKMTRLVLAATAFAAMCGMTVSTVSTQSATGAFAAAPATVATIEVYKDAN
jgi:hypothetical protein